MTNSHATLDLPRGLIVPIVTPLADQDRLDVATLERLVEHVIAGGVHGLFLLGSCGEGASLSDRLKREVLERVCRQVAGRAVVLVCAIDSSPANSIALAAHAADCGADAVVFVAPFYFPLTQAELLDDIERRTGQVGLPVVVYNFPAITKVAVAPETVVQLLDNPRIVGLKDTSGNLAYFQQVRRITQARPGWRLYMGPEQLLIESLKLGGDGGVCAGANVLPELFVRIFEAVVAGDADRLAPLATRAAALAEIYNCGEGPAAPAVRGLKAALAALGFGNGLPAEPLAPATDAQRERIAAIIRELTA